LHVTDEDRFGRTNDHAGWLKSNINAVRAEVTFFRRMVFRVDENRVVGTGGHAGLAADAD
jgi:hypothetical protein